MRLLQRVHAVLLLWSFVTCFEGGTLQLVQIKQFCFLEVTVDVRSVLLASLSCCVYKPPFCRTSSA